MQRSWVVPVVALAAVLLAVVAAVGLLGNDAPPDASGSAGGSAPPSPAGAAEDRTGAAQPTSEAAARDDASGACDRVARGVTPSGITIPGVVRQAGVVTPPRDGNGVPGVPPLTARGKAVFAWDREQGIRPGDAAGNVLLNAHTWPDGTALGNKMLAELRRGDRIVVHGSGSRLCYRVTERVEVLAEDGLPRYYATDGPPQLAIVVCSGRRLAPGVWEKRTVWFASPVRQG